MRFALYLLASFGLTAILIEGKPTYPIRWLAGKLLGAWGRELFSCYLCLGFWVGLGLSIPFFLGDALYMITSPFSAAGFSWALGKWVKAQVEIKFGGDGNEGN